MNKLLTTLLAASLIAVPAFANDTAPKTAPAAPTASEKIKSPAVGELVTPQANAAAMKEIIAQAKVESDAAKAKAAAGKK